MPVLVWFIFRTLSRHGVRLPSTESTWSETPRQMSQREVRLHVNWVNAEGTNIYEDFIIPRWLSWRRVSLCVDSVNMESHLALTQLTGNETHRSVSHRQMLKNLNKYKIENTQKTYYLAYVCLISAKTGPKKSHASVPLRWTYSDAQCIKH